MIQYFDFWEPLFSSNRRIHIHCPIIFPREPTGLRSIMLPNTFLLPLSCSLLDDFSIVSALMKEFYLPAVILDDVLFVCDLIIRVGP